MPMDNIAAVMAFIASRSPDFGKLVLQSGGITSACCLIDRNFILQLLHLHFEKLQAGQLGLAIRAEVIGIVFGTIYGDFGHFDLSVLNVVVKYFVGSGLGQSTLECCLIGHAGRVAYGPFAVQLPDLRIDELDIGDVRTHCLAKISNRVFFFVDGDLGVFGLGHLALSIFTVLFTTCSAV